MKSHGLEHLRWNRHTPNKPFKCHILGCTRSFTVKSSLQCHLKTCHNIQYDANSHPLDGMSTVEVGGLPLLNCLHNGCGEIFSSRQELRHHIYKSAPGLVSEVEFLKDTLLDVLTVVEKWNNMTVNDQVSFLVA